MFKENQCPASTPPTFLELILPFFKRSSSLRFQRLCFSLCQSYPFLVVQTSSFLLFQKPYFLHFQSSFFLFFQSTLNPNTFLGCVFLTFLETFLPTLIELNLPPVFQSVFPLRFYKSTILLFQCSVNPSFLEYISLHFQNSSFLLF